MEFNIYEWLNLVVRWIHVIFAIMWIGNSIFFNWLDNSFEPPKEEKDGVRGELWMLHGGGFYLVEKRGLKPDQIPEILHWFKWESYGTWLSGLSLMIVVYYLQANVYMVNTSVANISSLTAVMIGLGTIVGGWLFYDTVFKLFGNKNTFPPIAICLVALIGLAYVLQLYISGRSTYIHIGALLGTCMSGNVFFHIIPRQKQMMAATRAGSPPDEKLGQWAKNRSRHNNYMTFPVIFLMLSNHFPSTYGHKYNWLVLATLVATSATIKHFMNISDSFKSRGAYRASLITAVWVGGIMLYMLYGFPAKKTSVNTPGVKAPVVSFAKANAIIQKRCVPCHSKSSKNPVHAAVPKTSYMDTPAQIKKLATRIKVRSVDGKTMPLANQTKMTDEERKLLGYWIQQGAKLK